MRLVIQRVRSASVTIAERKISEIGYGFLILMGVEDSDTEEDIEWLSQKLVNLRVFDDDQGVMNKSIQDIGGEMIIVSQFTLHASTKKGNRPSYIRASKPDFAVPMYDKLVSRVKEKYSGKILTGEFGAEMQVELINDGPVTIIIDSKLRE